MYTDRTRAVLRRIISDPPSHVAWLNTLSLLEYTGARKIARTFRTPNDEVLRHLAEEARHARFFHTLAARVPGAEHSSVTLARGSGLFYFQRLDHDISADVYKRLPPRSAKLSCYYYVTAAIEERALEVYLLYNDLLREHDTGLRLDGVIAEEQGHLSDMYRELERLDADHTGAMKRYRDLEAGLFARFMGGIERALEQPAAV